MAKLKALSTWILEIVRNFWLVVIFILGLMTLFFLVGYWLYGNWDWTGFFYYEAKTVTTEITGSNPPTSITTELHPGKTLWDLLELVIIPLVITVGVWWLSKQERAAEQEIALDRTRETTLQSYLDRMTELMLKEGLRESKPHEPVRSIARALALTTLRQLDGKQKGTLILFLYEAGLITKPDKSKIVLDSNKSELIATETTIIDLRMADLEDVQLRGINLWRKIDLSGANLKRANFSGTDLHSACLICVDLRKANLSQANLSKSELIEADLIETDLVEADLSGANLTGAKVTTEQLNTAKSLKDTTLSDGTKHD